MKRKLISALLLALLVAGFPITALAAQPEDEFFRKGKESIGLLSYREYQKALALLDFDAQGEDQAQFEKRFVDFLEERAVDLFGGTVQSDVSLAYMVKDVWYLAVPVLPPEEEDVETLVYISKDGKRFSGYAVLKWGEVLDAADVAAERYWNIEYKRGVPVILPD